jgi:pimeloyl-ACP methyl ester carboxylesterase
MPGGKTRMNNLRTYGEPPFRIAAIHGGPGAGGEMAPVARLLADRWGVLEPIQTATSLQGQVQELQAAIQEHGALPVTLVGYSWGAWLSTIVAARCPASVGKLILVGSGPYEHRYLAGIHQARLGRLDAAERAEFEALIGTLDDPAGKEKDAAFARLGALASKTDQYDPLPDEPGEPEQAIGASNAFHGVLQEAQEWRKSGKLLQLAARIRCPVVAIHGDHDPHPAEGVREPLSHVLADFRFHLLARCGHKPWIERHARDRFYAILRDELASKKGSAAIAAQAERA